MLDMLTFSRRTLFINDPFSLVGKDVGQPICVKSEEGVKFQKWNASVDPITQIHKDILHNKYIVTWEEQLVVLMKFGHKIQKLK
jgi:hypothetical protein